MRVLTVNAGSSSLKVRLLAADDRLLDSHDGAAGTEPAGRDAFFAAIRWLGREADAVGHRVVHGGADLTGPVRIDTTVLERIRGLTDLAPLHQPPAIAGIEAVTEALPDLPSVACFDTAFHATLPAAASTYAVPGPWRSRWGVRRYGFHGLSHGYAARRAAEFLGRGEAGLRVVTCHLGAGASLAAVRDGRSLDTTMGFTPLDGLVMATRSGSVDPGLITWVQRHGGLSAVEVEDALEHRSGLLGLAGTPDMRAIVDAARSGDEVAVAALAVYQHRLRAGVAAMAAALDGLDVLVFTGGIGERSAEVRAAAAGGLGFLGVALDADANHGLPDASAAPAGDRDISAGGAAVRTLVLAAREDLEIARQTRAVLTG